MTTKELAAIVGLQVEHYRLGYKLTSNPNRLMANGVKKITVHQTGNTSYGADALRHHRLQANNFQGASWHWTVDEDGAIQSYRDDRVLWHSATKEGNETSMSIEMCIDADKVGLPIKGKDNYLKTLDNTAKLIAVKRIEHKETLDEDYLKQHYDWSRKDCPEQLRSALYGFTYGDFVALVDKYYTQLETALNPPVAPVITEKLAPEGKLYRLSIGAAQYKSNLYEDMETAKAAGLNPYFTLIDDPNLGGTK